MKVEIIREVFQDTYTLGRMLIDGKPFGYTCEDCDRELEKGGFKVKGETAIPTGLYPLTATMSTRFSRLMPLVKDVPGFTGVRIHGGNTHRDTEGCPLLGAVRTAEGVAGCNALNAALLKLIVDTERAGGECWLEVKNGKLA